jgi:hypothetical protein
MGPGNLDQTFFLLTGVPRITFPFIAITIIFTLLGEPRVQKTTFYFCLRRRMVSIYLKEQNCSHWSRNVLRVPANKTMLGWADFLKMPYSSSNLVLLLRPLCAYKKYVNRSLRQQSNTILCFNLDQNIHKICVIIVTFIFQWVSFKML